MRDQLRTLVAATALLAFAAVPALAQDPAPDTTLPDTQITAGPAEGAVIEDVNASFEFTSGDLDVASFQCSSDGRAFIPCTSPKKLRGLESGSHTFAVAAVDAAGNVDASPANVTWEMVVPEEIDQEACAAAKERLAAAKAEVNDAKQAIADAKGDEIEAAKNDLKAAKAERRVARKAKKKHCIRGAASGLN